MVEDAKGRQRGAQFSAVLGVISDAITFGHKVREAVPLGLLRHGHKWLHGLPRIEPAVAYI